MEKEQKDLARSFARNKWLWVALLSAMILGGIIYAVLSLTRGTELTETDAWQRVGHFQAAGELDSMEAALNDYLWTYGDGRYSEDARTLRDRLNRERDEWEKVVDNHCTLEAVDEYIYAHPDGFYRSEALVLLDSLSFLDAQEQNTEEALMNYMEQYPTGRFVSQAQTLLKSVEKTDVTDEEAKAAKATVEKHFKDMQENEQTIVTTLADNMSSYIGKPNPTVSDVLAYMAHFHKGNDTKTLSAKDFSVKKMMHPDGPMYSVQFMLVETINADDTTKCEVKNLKGNAILDAAMLMTSLVLEKAQ